MVMVAACNMNRTGSNLSDKVQAATRDADYWYDTGNFIIVSQGVAFRVWKCLLQEHSVVFRSMLAQSVTAGDLVDGCFVVMLDESPND